jgi:hypothetical protein
MSEETKIVEFLTPEQYEGQQALETRLNDIADAPKKILKFSRAAKVTRQDVVNAFTNAFQMIGGVDRLAVWADANPGEFFKIFGKLLPPSNTDLLDGNREFVVRHILPPPVMDVTPKTVVHTIESENG